MPELDEKIAEWRTRMAAGGIKTPAVLDELEAHVREDVERLVRSGRGEGEAFEAAVQNIGGSDLLKAEFAKIGGAKDWPVGKVIGGACCVFAALYSMLLAPPLVTVHELGSAQRFLGLAAVSLTLLFLASLRFGYRYLPVIQSRRTRIAAVSACALAGLVWLVLFSNLLPNVIVPRLMAETNSEMQAAPPVSQGFGNPLLVHNRVSLAGDRRFAQSGFLAPSGTPAAVFHIGIALFWAMTLAAVMGGVAYGLEEAARRNTKENTYV